MAGVRKTEHYGATVRHIWTLTTADPTGEAITYPGASDRVVQIVASNFGSATVVLEGSLDGENWFTLTDPQGNVISFTADGGELVIENTLFLRPRLSVAGSGADIDVKLFSRSTMR